jgi:hypothetical protein
MEEKAYIHVYSSGPMIIVRTPEPVPKWSNVLKALTKVMEGHDLRKKDIFNLERATPGPDDRWTEDDKEFADRLKKGFARHPGYVPDFWLYDWKDGEFVLVRKGASQKM